jgi:hypothetical protein
MTRRTREVMFRIGNEEDLLDEPMPAPSRASPPNWARTSDASEPLGAPEFPVRPADLAAPTAPRRRRKPPAHRHPRMQHHRTGQQDRSRTPRTHRRRPELRGVRSWIAGVNATILIVLLVAAVIGHSPPATPATGREPPTTTRQTAATTGQTAAQPAVSSVTAQVASTGAPPSLLAHRHDRPPGHRSGSRVALQSDTASRTAMTERSTSSSQQPPSPPSSTPPPAAVARPVAPSSVPAPPRPAPVSPRASRHRREAENSQNAAAVEFGP